jgi:hypothetical protein
MPVISELSALESTTIRSAIAEETAAALAEERPRLVGVEGLRCPVQF